MKNRNKKKRCSESVFRNEFVVRGVREVLLIFNCKSQPPQHTCNSPLTDDHLFYLAISTLSQFCSNVTHSKASKRRSLFRSWSVMVTRRGSGVALRVTTPGRRWLLWFTGTVCGVVESGGGRDKTFFLTLISSIWVSADSDQHMAETSRSASSKFGSRAGPAVHCSHPLRNHSLDVAGIWKACFRFLESIPHRGPYQMIIDQSSVSPASAQMQPIIAIASLVV